MTIIKGKPIVQIEEEAMIDMELRPDRVEADSAATPSIFNKYHKELRIVKTELINAQSRFKQLWNKKWYYYSGKADPKEYKKKPLDIKIMKSDVKMHIESDDEVLTLSVTIEMLEMKVKYINEILGQINYRGYHIGNMVKAQLFYAGKN